MNRGRAVGRGTRRGAASTGLRAEGGDEMDVAVKEEPVSSATPSSFPAAASSSRTTRATTTAGRFRPRVIRRDETERDALAQQEQQKADERAADERRARGRGRFRSKRSRGDTMGSRGGFGRPVAAASGPFSGNLAAGGGMRPGGGGWFGGGGGGGGAGGGGGKLEPRGQGFGNGGAEGYREARINADKLHAMTQGEDLDSDDEAMVAALQARAGNVMPMGIYRREHKDTPVVVATTAELEAQENIVNGMQEDEVVEEQGQEVEENEEEKSLWVEGSGPPVGDADEDEDGSGDAAVGVKREPTDDNMMAIDVEVRPEAAEQTDKGKRPATKTKKKKTVAAQDAEESMIRTDLSLLASELGAVAITEDDGESKGEGAANSKDGRLYLFQFPPLLPPLKHVAAPGAKVKEEAGGLQTTATAVDLTQGNDDDDEEEEEEEEDDNEGEDEEEEEKRGFRSQLLSKGGMIGRLNVRKSGKVELDWGGQILEMSPAAGMNFLTTAVIVEESDDKPQNGVTTGESMGMGKIMGRFVLAPVWSEEAEWEVKPEELVVDEPA